MRFEAIQIVHPEVVSLRGDYDARDKDDNSVVLHEPSIESEMAKLQAEQDIEDDKKRVKDEVEAILVDYIPSTETESFTFSGSESEQAKMTTSINMLAGKVDTKTRNHFDVNRVMHKLNRDDFDNLLDMIEPLYEGITDD